MGSYNSIYTTPSHGTSRTHPRTSPREHCNVPLESMKLKGRQQAIRYSNSGPDDHIQPVAQRKHPVQSEARRSLSSSGRDLNRAPQGYCHRDDRALDSVSVKRPTQPVASRNSLLSSSIESINSISSQATTAVSGGWLNDISDIRLSIGGSGGGVGGGGGGVTTPHSASYGGGSSSHIISSNNIDSHRHRFRYVNDAIHEEPVTPISSEKFSSDDIDIMNVYNSIKDSVKTLNPCVIPVRSADGILLLTPSGDVCFVSRFTSQSQHRASAYKMRVLLKNSQPYRLHVGRVSSSMEEEMSHGMASSSTPRATEDLSRDSRNTTVENEYPMLLHTADCKVFWIQPAILTASSPHTLHTFPSSSSSSPPPPLPKCLCMALHHIAAIFEGIRRTTPKLILYLATSSISDLHDERAGRFSKGSTIVDNDYISSEVDEHRTLRGKQRKGNVDCKCMLMSNSPMPDFQVQFADGTRLKYSLQRNTLLIERKQSTARTGEGLDVNSGLPSQGIRWEGSIDPALIAPSEEQPRQLCDNYSRNITMGSHLNSMPAHLRWYTTVAQKALSLCMKEHQLQQLQEESPRGMKSSSLPTIIVRE
jgi:hypothetical protein